MVFGVGAAAKDTEQRPVVLLLSQWLVLGGVDSNALRSSQSASLETEVQEEVSYSLLLSSCEPSDPLSPLLATSTAKSIRLAAHKSSSYNLSTRAFFSSRLIGQSTVGRWDRQRARTEGGAGALGFFWAWESRRQLGAECRRVERTSATRSSKISSAMAKSFS